MYLRITLVHSFYASNDSGENQTVIAQHNSLHAAGHDVQLIRFDSRPLPSLWDKAAAAWRVASGRGPDAAEAIRRFNPDVLHVHNLFPNAPTRGWGLVQVPMVMSLHNFRVICANGVLMRDGRHCTSCLTRGPAEAVRYACYRGSRAATLPLVTAQYLGRSAAAALEVAQVVTLPSQAALRVFEDAGLADRRWKVQEPYLKQERQLVQAGTAPRPNAPAVAVARLSPEKGLRELMAEWPRGWSLRVIGDGPQAASLRSAAPKKVEFVGRLPHDEVLTAMASARSLIFPSTAMETFGLVYLEALSVGTPVIARTGTVVAELISEQGTGYTYSDRDGLLRALHRVDDNRAALSRVCRSVYASRYTEEAWLTRAVGDYSEARQGYRGARW